MLEQLAAVQVRGLALKARAARDARDRVLAHVRDQAFREPKPERAGHDSAADSGVNVIPEANPERLALAKALSALPVPALRELWALMLIGQGDYGLKDWQRAIAEANRILDLDANMFMEQPDLHEQLMKAVYELEHVPGAAP
jgi:hypothetical protein